MEIHNSKIDIAPKLKNTLKDKLMNRDKLINELENSKIVDLSGSTIYTGASFNIFKENQVVEEINLENSIICINQPWALNSAIYNCTNLRKINITNCKILLEPDDEELNCNCLFAHNSKLEEVIGLDSFLHINYNIEDFSMMFKDCTSLRKIDLGKEYTFKRDALYNGMFANCSNLEEITLGNIDTILIEAHLQDMFKGVNPDVKINHTGRFKIEPWLAFYRADTYEEISKELRPRTPNPFAKLFIRKMDIDVMMNSLWKYAHGIDTKAVASAEREIIKVKDVNEIENLRAKHDILGTIYWDLVGGYIYIDGDYEKIVIIQEEVEE